MALKLRKPTRANADRAAFVRRQVEMLVDASQRVAKEQIRATSPVPEPASVPSRVPQFARGGSVDHGALSPDAQARAMLRDEGI